MNQVAEKPVAALTRREFERLFATYSVGEGRYALSGVDMLRIHATINAGGFTPEPPKPQPLTEEQLHAWLWGSIGEDAFHAAGFMASDLPSAMALAHRFGVQYALCTSDPGPEAWYIEVEPPNRETIDCNSTVTIARSIAALAWAAEDETRSIDQVKHLLGDKGQS